MDDCNGDARDAVVLAQLTWWLQPGQRNGAPRTRQFVERDGERWLYSTDEKFADEIGMSTSQVRRARTSLRNSGLVECQVRKINGARVTLTRPVLNDGIDVSETTESSDSQTTMSTFSSNDDSVVCTVIRPRKEITEEEAAPDGAGSLEADLLCTYLADRIEIHTEGNRPQITARWRNDMRLLLKRGPLGEVSDGLSEDHVRRAITSVFTELTRPGSDGFCWADQVRSPGALRKHYPKLRQAVKRGRTSNGSNGSGVKPGIAAMVERMTAG
jgi:hypothetical protein